MAVCFGRHGGEDAEGAAAGGFREARDSREPREDGSGGRAAEKATGSRNGDVQARLSSTMGQLSGGPRLLLSLLGKEGWLGQMRDVLWWWWDGWLQTRKE